MADDTESGSDDIVPANDNQGPEDGVVRVRAAFKRVDRVAIKLARIIGRRMARQDYAALVAANDNRPVASEESEGEADKE